MKNLLFPHDTIRPIQQELMNDIANAIENKRCLLAHAPTGLGKTAAALAPALSIALEQGYSIFFLTPKHTQHQIAVETLRQIKQKHNVSFHVADMIGKKWMCSVDAVDHLTSKDFNDYCKSVRDEERCQFYNNVWGKKSQLLNSAMRKVEELKQKGPLHSEELVRECKEDFCAFEIASLLARDAQVIIADYFHMFQPNVRDAILLRLKKTVENSIIIVDEGHNLPDRIRDILTERISTYVLSRAAKEAKALRFTDISIMLNYLVGNLETLAKRKLKSNREAYVEKDEFKKEVALASDMRYEEFTHELEIIAEASRRAEKRSFCGSVFKFLEAWDGEDVGFSRIISLQKAKSGNNVINLSYRCLSPALSAADVVNKSVSTIVMSGTLVPGEMYRDLLGFDTSRVDFKQYPSPFPQINRLALINPSVTTKFTSRSEDEYRKIARECLTVIENVPHNVAVFFPSYFMLQSIFPFMQTCKKQIFIEKPDLSKEQKSILLQGFKDAAEQGAVLLGVQGASFAEGVDYPGKLLEAVVVVGVPLGTPDLETKSLIDYYDYKFNKGWDYGYTYPAMTRALQAAGRCIRSQEDRGVVVFLDKRFAWSNYLKCIPPEWKPTVTVLVADKIKKFFEG